MPHAERDTPSPDPRITRDLPAIEDLALATDDSDDELADPAYPLDETLVPHLAEIDRMTTQHATRIGTLFLGGDDPSLDDKERLLAIMRASARFITELNASLGSAREALLTRDPRRFPIFTANATVEYL
jgi:hypothetical protein